MINDQQIGIRDQGFRYVSLRNLPFDEMPNAEGFSSQQEAMEGGTVTGRSWTPPAALSDTCFELRTECRYNQSIIPSSGTQASKVGSSVHANYKPLGLGLGLELEADSTAERRKCVTSVLQSRDTLQSLIQSSFRRSQNTQSSEENSGYQIGNDFQQNQLTAANKLRDWSHYPNIGFPKNLQVENEVGDCHHKGHNYSPITRNASDRAALMAKRNRIRWTPELHHQFIECVNRLGGAKKATPKGILKLMNCDGLTIFHIKSHLQKYRVAQYTPVAKEDVENRDETWRISSPELDQEVGVKILEALKMQIDVQRCLYEQLQWQKDLQLCIEEQAQQLKKMFDIQGHSDIMPTKDDN